ncbi:MAG: zinc metalloprotease HtpX, partial [Pseudomonadota bacterium]
MRPEIEYTRLISHRLSNFLQTLLLLSAMVVLVILIGYFFAGAVGLVWAALLGFVLLSISIKLTPAIILTLYRARPMTTAEAPELHQLTFELARRAELTAPPRLYYVPSSTLNAFAVGSRESAHIGLTDGLLRLLNGRELAGVLAHELSHIKNNDVRVMGIADMLTRMTSFFSTFGQILLLINLPLLLIDGATIPWLAILILIAAPAVNALLQLALS